MHHNCKENASTRVQKSTVIKTLRATALAVNKAHVEMGEENNIDMQPAQDES